MYKAPHRLYTTADRTRVVPEDDPAATFLLAAEGDVLTDDEAARYGLSAETAEMTPAPVAAMDDGAEAPPPVAGAAPSDAGAALSDAASPSTDEAEASGQKMRRRAANKAVEAPAEDKGA